MSQFHRLNHWLSVMGVVSTLLLSACGNLVYQPRTYTIGIVSFGSPLVPSLDEFKAELAEMGYVEGENVTYVYSEPADSQQQLEATVQRLLDAHVDVILALKGQATVVAKELTRDTLTPIVFVTSSDPVKEHIVTSLSHPGGNLTGISMAGGEAKRLEWLYKLAPQARRIYIPYDPGSPSSLTSLSAVQDVAPKLGLELEVQDVSTAADLDQVVKTLPQDIDALFLPPDTLVLSRSSDFSQLALERRLPISLPTIYGFEQRNELFAFGVDPAVAVKQSARLVGKVLAGTPPGEIPVETAELFLAINLRTARTIGLTIPDTYVQQAHQVVR